MKTCGLVIYKQRLEEIERGGSIGARLYSGTTSELRKIRGICNRLMRRMTVDDMNLVPG